MRSRCQASRWLQSWHPGTLSGELKNWHRLSTRVELASNMTGNNWIQTSGKIATCHDDWNWSGATHGRDRLALSNVKSAVANSSINDDGWKRRGISWAEEALLLPGWNNLGVHVSVRTCHWDNVPEEQLEPIWTALNTMNPTSNFISPIHVKFSYV